MNRLPIDVIVAHDHIQHIFSGTIEPEARVQPEPEHALPPVPAVEPVTRDDLDDYVAGLRQLTKRKRALGPAIEDVQANLEDVSSRIDEASKYVDDMKALFDAFPRDLRTDEIAGLQDRLTRVVKLQVDKFLVTARDEQDELLDARTSLTGYLVAMNEAGALAGSEPPPKNACPVCLTNPIEMVCDPCGHTFCSGCSRGDATFRTACPMCRTIVNKRIKVFFSL